MGEVTDLLRRWNEGDDSAFDELMPFVYNEMRSVARRLLNSERIDHTLNSGGLVHESYLRLLEQNRVQWSSRGHFFGAAANAMRRILVDHARQRLANKRGAGARKIGLQDLTLQVSSGPDIDVVALDDALNQLGAFDPARARIVELRYFAGLSIEETASLLGVSSSAVNRDWAIARAWLLRRLRGHGRPPGSGI